jgi:hypothetical protein
MISFSLIFRNVVVLAHLHLLKIHLVLLGSVLVHLLLGLLMVIMALSVNLILRGVVILVRLVNHSLLIALFFLALDIWLLLKVVLLLRVNFGALLGGSTA